MKKSNEIVAHVIKSYNLNKVVEIEKIKRVENILEPNIKKFLKFSYLKGDILYFVFIHPSITTEFNYKIKTLKSILKQYSEFDFIKDIKAYSDHKSFVLNNKNKMKKKSVEISKLTFVNLAKDADIFEAFERLKSVKADT